MDNYDVVIIGAGPAGGECARKLARNKRKVLLVERFASFDLNNFSSAGTPMSTIKDFNLPDSIIGEYWNKLEIISSKTKSSWKSDTPLGAILDFAKLRKYLSKELTDHGGTCLLGTIYQSHVKDNESCIIKLLGKDKLEISVRAKIIVDATGPARSVMKSYTLQKQIDIAGLGYEMIIELDSDNYIPNTMLYFLGDKYIKNGYSWIFSMGNNRLKIGAAYFDKSEKEISTNTTSLKDNSIKIIEEYLKVSDYKIIDEHGGAMRYIKDDTYYHENIIAIGDACSTINPLGGEGIRHAMQSADIAYRYIEKHLKGEIDSFKSYSDEIKSLHGLRWKATELISLWFYNDLEDWKVDKLVSYLQNLKTSEIMDLLFDYKIEKGFLGLDDFLRKRF